MSDSGVKGDGDEGDAVKGLQQAFQSSTTCTDPSVGAGAAAETVPIQERLQLKLKQIEKNQTDVGEVELEIAAAYTKADEVFGETNPAMWME
jgi:hypothetical protein